MKVISIILFGGLMAGCQVNIPIGENGKYGEAFVGYRPPAAPFIVSEAPLFRDK